MNLSFPDHPGVLGLTTFTQPKMMEFPELLPQAKGFQPNFQTTTTEKVTPAHPSTALPGRMRDFIAWFYYLISPVPKAALQLPGTRWVFKG